MEDILNLISTTKEIYSNLKTLRGILAIVLVILFNLQLASFLKLDSF